MTAKPLTYPRATASAIRAFWLLALSLAFVLAQAIASQARPESFADLADEISPAVVNITTSTVVAQGTGPSPIVPEGSPFEDFFRSLSDQGRTVISPDGRMAKISVRAEWLDNEDTLALADRLKRTLENSLETENATWYITGFSMMYVELNQRVIDSQIRSRLISIPRRFR